MEMTTFHEMLKQATTSLSSKSASSHQSSLRSVQQIAETGLKVADGFEQGQERADIMAASQELERAARGANMVGGI